MNTTDPLLCAWCEERPVNAKRGRKFCSASCSASWIAATRDPAVWKARVTRAHAARAAKARAQFLKGIPKVLHARVWALYERGYNSGYQTAQRAIRTRAALIRGDHPDAPASRNTAYPIPSPEVIKARVRAYRYPWKVSVKDVA